MVVVVGMYVGVVSIWALVPSVVATVTTGGYVPLTLESMMIRIYSGSDEEAFT